MFHDMELIVNYIFVYNSVIFLIILLDFEKTRRF